MHRTTTLRQLALRQAVPSSALARSQRHHAIVRARPSPFSTNDGASSAVVHCYRGNDGLNVRNGLGFDCGIRRFSSNAEVGSAGASSSLSGDELDKVCAIMHSIVVCTSNHILTKYKYSNGMNYNEHKQTNQQLNMNAEDRFIMSIRRYHKSRRALDAITIKCPI